VPKPHTPFQWERQLTLEESRDRINRLKSMLPRKGFKLKWQDPTQSYVEGVFSRGDRRLSSLIEAAWKSGVRFDSWSEHFHLENWQQAAEECGMDLDFYLQARSKEKPLPWDHLDCGVDREFLLQEYQNSLERVYTPDCRSEGCQKCGLCDFKTIFPVVHSVKKVVYEEQNLLSEDGRTVDEHERVFHSRVHYTRLGDNRFFSHLEILQLIFRALTRAGVPVLYSQGYNPSPRISFSPALPVGMESDIEFFDMALPRPLSNPDEIAILLDNELPPGMKVTGITTKPDKEPEALLVDYTINLVNPLTEEQQDNIAEFLGRDSHVIVRVRKRKRRELDIRPMLSSLKTDGSTMAMTVVNVRGEAGISPKDILKEAACLSEEDVLLARIKKIAVTIFSANA
jgi:radical SAM-linked protein